MAILDKSADQTVADERQRKIDEAMANTPKQPNDGVAEASILGFLDKRWQSALRAKRDIEQKFFDNLDQAFSRYSPQKLSFIRQMKGSEAFVGVTDVKCRNAIAWITDIEFQPGQRPYGIEPTPVPDVPPSVVVELTQKFFRETLNMIMTEAQQRGVQVDPGQLAKIIQDAIPEFQDRMKKVVKSKVRDMAADFEDEMDDLLVEGMWYDALESCVPDLVILGTSFIKGPVRRMKPKLVTRMDELTGEEVVDVESSVIDEWERRSPFNIYPQPSSSRIGDGYLYDLVSYRAIDLQGLIGVEGFNSEEIEEVLREAEGGTLRDWTGIESDRATREKKDTQAVYDLDIIDSLEYYGTMPGKMLRVDLGMTDQVDESQNYHEFRVFVSRIGRHIIKAVINEDPLGRIHYSKASYDPQNDAFWGRGCPELFPDLQAVVNACTRGLVNNIAMGSGPQVEINVDRLLGRDKGDLTLVPWKRWLSTNHLMQSGPAISFWQAKIYAGEILNVINSFIKMIDEHSAIPAWAHGDPSASGAGNTSSGLSMLISQASRAIRRIVKHIDTKLIVPSIQVIYDRMAMDPKYKEIVGDLKLIAKGSMALIEKEQRAIRLAEALKTTNNPIDMQLTGMQGRGYLLNELFRSHSIDVEKALPNAKLITEEAERQIIAQAFQKMPGGGTNPASGGVNPAGPATLDQAGNPAQGVGSNLVPGGSPEEPGPEEIGQ
jgi:hypothetical protein